MCADLRFVLDLGHDQNRTCWLLINGRLRSQPLWTSLPKGPFTPFVILCGGDHRISLGPSQSDLRALIATLSDRGWRPPPPLWALVVSYLPPMEVAAQLRRPLPIAKHPFVGDPRANCCDCVLCASFTMGQV